MWIRIDGQAAGVNLDACFKLAIEGTGANRTLMVYPNATPAAPITVFAGTMQECVQYIRDVAPGLINGI
jgi:hypothetical protein